MTGTTPTTTELTREELYERIWSTSARHLAKEFGISDVGLAKICKRYRIPKPPVGYWTRVAHGNAPKRAPLRAGEDLPPLPIAIKARSSHPTSMDTLHPDVRESLGKPSALRPIKVSKRLISPRPIVAHTLKSLNAGRLNDRGGAALSE